MKPRAEERILSELASWESEKNALPPALDLYRRLLVFQARARGRIPAPSSTPDARTVGDRLRSGRPALAFADLAIDHALFSHFCGEVLAVCRDHTRYLEQIGSDVTDRLVDMRLAERWFNAGQASQNPEPLPLAEICLQAIFYPLLQAYSSRLLPLIDREHWYRGYCPVCGGNPDFAYLDKERGARHLVCSCCDTEWPFLRLRCPYCDNQDAESLAYYSSADSKYRLYVCEKCRAYVKAIDLRQTNKEVLLPLERLASHDLDKQAYEKGYHLPPARPALPAGRA